MAESVDGGGSGKSVADGVLSSVAMGIEGRTGELSYGPNGEVELMPVEFEAKGARTRSPSVTDVAHL